MTVCEQTKVIREIKTQIPRKGTLGKLDDLKNEIKVALEKLGDESYWLIYNQNEVLLGKGEISDESIDFGILKESRLFSNRGELHVWKYDGAFRFRLRIDNSGAPEEKNEKIYIEEHFRLDTEDEVTKIRRFSENALLRTSGIKLAGDLTEIPDKYRAVSYTHLTLPTIYSV